MATPTIGFIMSATESLKRPAEGEAETGADEPASKVARVTQPHSFKNVFKLLSLMRPGLFFEMEPDPEGKVDAAGAPVTYHMVVDVDGVKFKGVGPSKRNAKVQAAEKVLAHLESLGVKPREPTEEEKEKEKPVKPTEPKVKPETYVGLTEEQKAQQLSGKNPVMMLHEIRPNFDSEIESDERRGAHRKVTISVTVEGVKYIGEGRSNKNARARAAVAALNAMFGLEFTEFGENEIPVYLGDEWNWRQYTKRAEKTGGVQAQAKSDDSGKQIKNAVMQLNDMYKGLEFSVVDRSGPDHCPFFKVSVEIEDRKYEGEGSTKKAAKLDAAERALEGLTQSGVLANRAPGKKQLNTWAKKSGLTWDSKGNFVYQSENSNMGGYGHGGGGNTWGDREQNGQSGMRGRGRGGRGVPRGQGRGGQMRGGGPRGGGTMHGSGPVRGRGSPRGRGSWGSQGETPSTASLLGGMGRGRGSVAPMLPPPPPPPPLPSTRARGGRVKSTRGATHLATMPMPSPSWGLGSSTSSTTTDYSSYQDPYTSDTSTGWNSQSYGYDSKAYGQSYGYDNKSYTDNSYANNSYDTSYDTSYDKSFGGGSSTFLNDSSYKNYQAAGTTSSVTSSWGEYYGY